MKIISFGITKDITGSMFVDFDAGAENLSINEFKNRLFQKFPDLKTLKTLSFAKNNEYITNDSIICDTDEIALIPPVSGG